MGENFEPSHVPQQSRRNKLRVMVQTHLPQPFPPSFQATTAHPFEPNPVSSPCNPNTLFNFSFPITHADNTKPPHSCHFLTKNTSCSASSHLEYYPKSFHDLIPPHLVVHAPQGPCNDLRNWGPVVPFTGYSSILKRSRFLKPAQQLLEDLCGSVLDPSTLDGLSENGDHEDPINGTVGDGVQHQWRDSILGCMLEEVYKKYILYCQQMQSVVASFQKVAGLGNATPYISFGIKTISKHFGSLKHAIYDQLQFTIKSTPKAKNFDEKEILNNLTFEKGLWPSESVQSLHSVQPILRSQRGLPDHAVALLRRWLFENFLHPYPTDSEKDTLAQQTGLSRCQVSNWFINARVRIWKPMVEAMHMHGEEQAQPSEVNHNTGMPTVGPYATVHKPMCKTCPNQLDENIPSNDKGGSRVASH